MSSLDLLIHLLNFMAPAFWIAVLVPLLARIFIRKVPLAPTLLSQVAINFIVSVGVVGLGLWYFGHDGKLTTYLAMTLLCATSQWFMLRGFRAVRAG